MTEFEKALNRVGKWLDEDRFNRCVHISRASEGGRWQIWLSEPSHEIFGEWKLNFMAAMISLAEKLKGEGQ